MLDGALRMQGLTSVAVGPPRVDELTSLFLWRCYMGRCAEMACMLRARPACSRQALLIRSVSQLSNARQICGCTQQLPPFQLSHLACPPAMMLTS